MPVVEKDQDEKKKQVQPILNQQATVLAMVPRLPNTPEEQKEVQDVQSAEKLLQAKAADISMKGQAQKAGETVFFKELGRGTETVGLLIAKNNPSRQLPAITEDKVKDVLTKTQQAAMLEGRTVVDEYDRRKGEIRGDGGLKASAVRLEYEKKLGEVPAGPQASVEIAKLGEWRAGELAKIRDDTGAKLKDLEDWKSSMSGRTKAEVELGHLTNAVMDLYSLTPEEKSKFEPAIRDLMRDARATANQAYTSERDNVYNQLKKEAASKS